MRWLLVALVVCGCQSDRPSDRKDPPSPPPDPARGWSLQLESAGGKPPGTHYRTLLASDGKLTTTSGTETTCSTVLPAAAIDAITKAIAGAKLESGLPAETHNGSLTSLRILTVDGQPYAVPSTPEFAAALDAAFKVAADMCPKRH